MKALVLKIGAFLIFCLSFWKWGQATAEKRSAENKSKETIKRSKKYEKINSDIFVDNPASRMCQKRK